MRAIVFRNKEEGPKLIKKDEPVPGKDEVLVKIKFASLNHLDLWIWNESSLTDYMVSGSDGSGVVEKAGDKVSQDIIGKEVLFNPGFNWGSNENVQGDGFGILGNDCDGSFAGYIVLPAHQVHIKPAFLSLAEAAALPMAALTAYRVLFTKARIHPQDKVLVTGIGGGAALYLLQMATAIGCNVYVTSSSADKISAAIKLGAKNGFNYRDQNWVKQAKEAAGGFDVIVDSAGGNGFADLLEVANPGARIISFGRTAGNMNNLRPGLIYNKQLQIMGSLMGTGQEFQNMLDFFEKYQLHPVIDKVYPLDQFQEAVDHMKNGKHFGKILLQVSED